MRKIYLFIVVIIGFISNSISQDSTCTVSFSVSADIVSQFIWRGAVASATPNIQPAVGFSANKFSVGTWGSTDFTGNVKEIDVFVGYSIKGLSITLTDYFWNTQKKYFDFDNSSTGHIFELGVAYQNEKFPLNIYAGTMFYGEDKTVFYTNTNTDSLANNYSTYIQLDYTFTILSNNLNVFMGATPFTGMYGKDFAVIHAGFTATKEIKITNNFSLPIFATFAANPQSQNYFAFFGISL